MVVDGQLTPRPLYIRGNPPPLGCGRSLEAIWTLWGRGKLFLRREFNYDFTIVQSIA